MIYVEVGWLLAVVTSFENIIDYFSKFGNLFGKLVPAGYKISAKLLIEKLDGFSFGDVRDVHFG